MYEPRARCRRGRLQTKVRTDKPICSIPPQAGRGDAWNKRQAYDSHALCMPIAWTTLLARTPLPMLPRPLPPRLPR